MNRIHAGEPSRKVRLQRRARLERSDKGLDRRKPLRRVGRKGAERRERMDVARPVVFARDLWRCQARIVGECIGEAQHAHHVLPRSRGGPDTLENLVSLCMPCHTWTHAHPDEATALGLLRSRFGA